MMHVIACLLLLLFNSEVKVCEYKSQILPSTRSYSTMLVDALSLCIKIWIAADKSINQF